MIKGTQDHLTDDQFTDLLIGGALTQSCRRHLAECVVCRREAEEFTRSVGIFSTTSLAWSRTKPQKSLRTIARWKPARAQIAPIGWALTAALLIAVGVPAWNKSHPGQHAQALAAPSAPADSPAEIAQDNQLMQSVNVALNTSDDSPLPDYRFLTGSRRLRTDARLR